MTRLIVVLIKTIRVLLGIFQWCSLVQLSRISHSLNKFTDAFHTMISKLLKNYLYKVTMGNQLM